MARGQRVWARRRGRYPGCLDKTRSRQAQDRAGRVGQRQGIARLQRVGQRYRQVFRQRRCVYRVAGKRMCAHAIRQMAAGVKRTAGMRMQQWRQALQQNEQVEDAAADQHRVCGLENGLNA